MQCIPDATSIFFSNMSASKNVGVSVAPRTYSFECVQCRQSVVISGLKCDLCSKVYHPRCGGRVKMCCGRELTNPLTFVPNSELTIHNNNNNIYTQQLYIQSQGKNPKFYINNDK
ncbi:hypothetical protein WA026_017694 [Henosepilachna vigintioctopunctata]|uniref:Phorbol-ester/DAG-type domain-containing protein n=1 Tax=Henosepilachna vigintioctopunctata TaxID=420089 RepID=A0AAW1U0L8_9CUCU